MYDPDNNVCICIGGPQSHISVSVILYLSDNIITGGGEGEGGG